MRTRFARSSTGKSGAETEKSLLQTEKSLQQTEKWNAQKKYNKEIHLDYYMAKNLCLLSAHTANSVRTENGGDHEKACITLKPSDFVCSEKASEETRDPDYFRQSPNNE